MPLKSILSLCGVQTDVIKGAPADPSALVASQLGLELYELGKEVLATRVDELCRRQSPNSVLPRQLDCYMIREQTGMSAARAILLASRAVACAAAAVGRRDRTQDRARDGPRG